MSNRWICLLVTLAVVVLVTGCTVQVASPPNHTDRLPTTQAVDQGANVYYITATPSPSPTAVSVAQPAEQIPSGSVALFYRASFSSDTERLTTVVTDNRGEGNFGVANITWETGSKGIIRYIPATGQTDVIKTITSTSYSTSSIYPITVGDHLYAVRDWGSDWTVDNKRFTIQELDPYTGAVLSSVDITAEWFTILEDRVVFKDEVKEDFWNGSRSGGRLKVQNFGSSDARDLSMQDVRLHSVADRLVSVEPPELRWHDPVNAYAQSTSRIEALSQDNLWPDTRHIFYGDQAVLWAWSEAGSEQVHIVRVPFEGEPEVLVSFDLEGFETGLVIDEHKGKVLVGVTASQPPRGIGISQVFLMDTTTGDVTEITPDQFIPSAQPDAGGGLQLLVMP